MERFVLKLLLITMEKTRVKLAAKFIANTEHDIQQNNSETIGAIQSCYGRKGEPMCYITREKFQCPKSTPIVMVTMLIFHKFPKNPLEKQN